MTWYPNRWWRSLSARFGTLLGQRTAIIAGTDDLENFINMRSAHVAQTALYGYLRTRAGARFPELFANDEFVGSINIAKWQVWLACVSDLTVYSGVLLRRKGSAPAPTVARLMQETLERILARTGMPADAGSDFVAGVERVRSRILLCDWEVTGNDDDAFAQSPAALVQWAPVTEDLKALDEEIVRNSVRFRWHEVRRELLAALRAENVLAEARALAEQPPSGSPR